MELSDNLPPMSRPLRIQYPGAVYHVMNRGAGRQVTFVDDKDYRAFLATVDEAHARWKIEVFAYCLMRNHYHLCFRTPKGNLSRVMRHIDGIYTQRFNRRHGRDGALFRGRYKALVVEADEYLAAVVRYVHLNAVEAGFVRMPEEYVWASHRYYYGAKGVPKWLNTTEAMEQIGQKGAFHEFVLSGNEESLERYYEAQRQSPVLGSDEFIERIRQPKAVVSREVARYERRVVQTGPERLIAEVLRRYRVRREELFRSERGKENEARKVAMYLVRRCCERTLTEVAEYFGAGSYAAASWSCRQIEAKMRKDNQFQGWINMLTANIHQLQT